MKKRVICIITGEDYEGGEDPTVHADVITMLEGALKGAKKGYIQEMCIAITTIDGDTFKDWSGDTPDWKKMYGQLMDLAENYRECCSDEMEEED